jgi:integrase
MRVGRLFCCSFRVNTPDRTDKTASRALAGHSKLRCAGFSPRALRAGRPTIGSDKKRALDEDEIGKLLAAAGNFRALVAVGIFAGLRLGESLGLTWADVDFEDGFIRVRAQLGRDRQRVEVKSDAGARDVVLMPQLARVLREHRLVSPFSQDGDFVFPAPDGRGRDHRSASRGVERAVERAKLSDVSSHTFRHTFASLLIVGLRLDPVRVARQLGHASATTTLNTYAHLFENARHADELRASMEDGFGHLLAGNAMETGARNSAQAESVETALVSQIGS